MARFMKTLAWIILALYFLILCIGLLSLPQESAIAAVIPTLLLLIFGSLTMFGLLYSIGVILELLQDNRESQKEMVSLLIELRDAIREKPNDKKEEPTEESLPEPVVDIIPEVIDAHTIRCPRCGTELRSEITRCFYCGATFRRPDSD